MKALIFGITGQDGTLLAQYLQNKGLSVVGTSRNIKKINLNTLNGFKIHELNTLSFSEIFNLIKLSSSIIRTKRSSCFFEFTSLAS
jgi:GDP-D-mannose dehydratase